MAWEVEEYMPAYELDDWLAWMQLEQQWEKEAHDKAQREARANRGR